MKNLTRALSLDPAERDRLLALDHDEPHRVLGAHHSSVDGVLGVVVRALHPDAVRAECLSELFGSVPMEPIAPGLYAVFLPGAPLPFAYRLRFHFRNGACWERDDPYRFLPTIGEVDLHLFNEGTHRHLWRKLGVHRRRIQGVEGVAFAVWAPTARRVSVVGDFCRWDGRLYPMRRLGNSGVFELFVPGVMSGALYKFEIKTREGALRVKADPFAFSMEMPPSTASRVVSSSYAWGDEEWMLARPARNPLHEPMTIYEVHLGSWARLVEEGNRPLTYREVAQRLVEHVQRFGFTHLELMPVAEHPFYGSWGYQVTGYYAPTARYGTPDDFRHFVDVCHQAGVGIILDWVPAHFPKDDFALRRFDGTALYEHEDPRMAEHPDWGTLIFNYGRHEVRNFLIANALYWLEEFHIDGLRVDAVSSMLYLDYNRKAGEWKPNRFGGRENLEAISFLQQLNETVHTEYPGCFTVAEESTAWPRVSHPVAEGGLGFTFKWNMGWMHDTLKYFKMDPLFRKDHQGLLTFGIMYEWSERFILPLSHDEVVHLKKSLLEKMPGDRWRKFAQLRLLLAYQWTRPGKKLLFMGSEIAPHREWNHDMSLDWHLQNEPYRAALAAFLTDLGRLYRESPCLWRLDPSASGFSWIDCSDNRQSIVSFVRRDGDDFLLVVLNFTPVPRESYRVGAPLPGRYVERLSSDDRNYAGSEFQTLSSVQTEPVPFHGQGQSMLLRVPPLGALVLELSPEDRQRLAVARLGEARKLEAEAASAAEAEVGGELADSVSGIRLVPLDPDMDERNRQLERAGHLDVSGEAHATRAVAPPSAAASPAPREPVRYIDLGTEAPAAAEAAKAPAKRPPKPGGTSGRRG